MQLGLIHIYTGSGKGKTTASLGLSLRALGRGYKIFVIQFMKKGAFGELSTLKRLLQVEVRQFGSGKFVDPKNPSPNDKAIARKALRFAKKLVVEGKYDMVILDEINVALDMKLIKLGNVLTMLNSKPWWVELVLTGRGAHPKLLEAADIVTEMKEIKHPHKRGIKARKGIEY
jgi:cob(I)alamin adenosyltransferase